MTTISNPNSFQIISQLSPEFSSSFGVALGVVGSIAYGSPVKAVDAVNASPWLGTVAAMVDADGTTAQRFMGLAKSTSTDTVAAAGSVDVWLPLPGLVYSGKAKSTGANTAAKLLALLGKGVFFDLTGAVWSIDEGATAAQVNCVIITGGDYTTSTLYWAYKSVGTFLDSCISA